LLTDQQATLAAIEERFGQLAACSADDVVVVATCEDSTNEAKGRSSGELHGIDE
jgi:hypothetical protein